MRLFFACYVACGINKSAFHIAAKMMKEKSVSFIILLRDVIENGGIFMEGMTLVTNSHELVNDPRLRSDDKAFLQALLLQCKEGGVA